LNQEMWNQPTEHHKHCRKQQPPLSLENALELLFDWRVRMLPGHWFILALWGAAEDPSLIACDNSA
jgi:hypothetical protein